MFVKTENLASRETLTQVHEEVHWSTAYGEELEPLKCPQAGGWTKCVINIQWNTAQQRNE